MNPSYDVYEILGISTRAEVFRHERFPESGRLRESWFMQNTERLLAPVILMPTDNMINNHELPPCAFLLKNFYIPSSLFPENNYCGFP